MGRKYGRCSSFEDEPMSASECDGNSDSGMSYNHLFPE